MAGAACAHPGVLDGARGRRRPAVPPHPCPARTRGSAAARLPARRAALTRSRWRGSGPRDLIRELFLAPVAPAAEQQECFPLFGRQPGFGETSPPASGFHLWPFGEHEGCCSFNSLLTPSSMAKPRREARKQPELSDSRCCTGMAPCPREQSGHCLWVPRSHTGTGMSLSLSPATPRPG